LLLTSSFAIGSIILILKGKKIFDFLSALGRPLAVTPVSSFVMNRLVKSNKIEYRPKDDKEMHMRKLKSLLFIIFGIGAVSIIFAGFAAAASYPSKPVKLVIAMAPGGSNDLVGRMIAAKLTERLGKQVIVENYGGGGGLIGAELVAKADPDGYTLLIISGSHIIQSAFHTLPYDPIKSYSIIARIGTVPNGLVVHPSVPANSMKEIIVLAKQKPGQLIFGTAGVGSTPHLAAELVAMMADIQIKIMHFKGGGPAMIDLLGGHSQALFGSINQLMPHIKSGAFRLLATGGLKRTAVLPDVPTISEAGVPGYNTLGWWGIVAPASTPVPIIDSLNNELKAILASEDVRKWFLKDGAEADYMGPTEFSKFLEEESTKWKRVVKTANIKLD
jgi:tripartite-type tricarboxylate transporter receptor subunit TctC